jgi:hypothetical protein
MVTVTCWPVSVNVLLPGTWKNSPRVTVSPATALSTVRVPETTLAPHAAVIAVMLWLLEA